jgi:hypothetical protein
LAPDEFVKKIAQDVAQAIFCNKIVPNHNCGIRSQNMSFFTNTQRKQPTNGRKFNQSGHPIIFYLIREKNNYFESRRD